MNSFLTARVALPFGLDGFVRIKALSGETGHLLKLKSVRGRLNGNESVFEIEGVEEKGPAVVVKFRGVDSPEAARELCGMELIVERDCAAPLKKDEYYIEELKGLELTGTGGEVFGRISGVFEGGGGFLLEISLAAGGVRLVPFRNEFIGGVFVEKGFAVLLESWILE